MVAAPRHVAGGGSAAVMSVMSDAPPAGTESSSYPPYDQSLELALAGLSAEVRAEWRHRYVTQGEAELRVQASSTVPRLLFVQRASRPRYAPCESCSPTASVRLATPVSVPRRLWLAWRWGCGPVEQRQAIRPAPQSLFG